MNPQYSSEQVEQLYKARDEEDLAAIYNRITTSHSVRAEYLRKLEMLEAALRGRGRLLDFACGSGGFFEMAQQRGWDAHGTELGNWAAAAAAARRLKNLHVGELRDLRFTDASFDVVYAAQVFEHLQRPTNELAEIRRILRPGGLLYIDVPNYHTLSIVLGRDDFMLNEPPQHVNYFGPASLRRMIADAGFEEIQLSSGGGLKWENLVGRSIRSDIASAYGLSQRPGESAVSVESRQSWRAHLKAVAMASVVKPLLYERLKLGMNLVALARRP